MPKRFVIPSLNGRSCLRGTIGAVRPCLLILSLFALLRPIHAQTLHQTIATVQRRMVKLYGAGGPRKLPGYATGILISPQGHIATAWSHILYAGDVTAVLSDGRHFKADVLGAEPQLDMAVVKIDAGEASLSCFDINKVATASPGTRVLGFSNAFQVAAGDEDLSVLHGVIAARTTLSARRGAARNPYRGEVYVVDAVTNSPGAAGGALVTLDGRLLGMIGKEVQDTASNAWINYAIPMAEATDVLNQIITGNFESKPQDDRDVDHPNRYAPIDFGLIMVPDVVPRTPPYIDAVLPDSLAAKQGVQSGDLVVFVNDRLVQSCRSLREQLGRLEAGDTVRMVVRRADRLVTVECLVPRKLNH